MAREESTFRLDRDGLAAVVNSAPMAQAMADRAEQGRAWATQEAKRSAHGATGVYSESFIVETRVEKINGINRSVAVLLNTDQKAWAVEWGNGGHHLLARAVDVIKKAR